MSKVTIDVDYDVLSGASDGKRVKSFVVHCKRDKYDVYIGRPSKWSNPFVIGKDGDRDSVIQKYRDWLMTRPELLSALPELRGKVLGCWCAPRACHGDILSKLANSPDSTNKGEMA